MNLFVRISNAILFTYLISACGGGGGSSNPPPPPPPPPPVTLSSLAIQMPMTEMLTEGDPVLVEVFANYSDNSQSKLISNVTFSLSDSDAGEVIRNNNNYYLDTYAKSSQFTLTATYNNVSGSIQIDSYLAAFNYGIDSEVLPLDASIPVLSGAFLLENGVNYDAFEAANYLSLNQELARFMPKTDSVLLNSSRNTSYGHLKTLQPGTVTLQFSLLNSTKESEVTIGSHRLLTTDETEQARYPNGAVFFNIFDVATDQNDDSYFLTGALQLYKYFIFSRYSKSEQRWYEDLVIDLPQVEVDCCRATLVAGGERLAFSWATKEIGYVGIIDKVTNTYQLHTVEGATHIDGIAIDSNDNVLACWNAGSNTQCRIERNGTGWSDIYTLPVNIKSGLINVYEMHLSDNNVFYVPSYEQNLDGSFTITGNTFQVTSGAISQLSSEVITTPYAFNDLQSFCIFKDVSAAGNFVCHFYDVTNTALNADLYVLSYTATNGWSVEHMRSNTNANYRYVKTGINDNGNIMLMIADSKALVMRTFEYIPASGWENEIIFDSGNRATPYIEHAPVYTQNGWKTFLNYSRSIVTKVGDSWIKTGVAGFGNNEDYWDSTKAYGPSYSDHVSFNSAGEMAIMWSNSWSYIDYVNGGFKNNAMFMALPIK